MIGREGKSHAGDVSGNNFEELFEAKIKEFQDGDIIKGKVVQITQDSVMVDIGYKSEGQVPLKEFLDKDGNPTVKVGDDITVLLERREDDRGHIVLSKAKADQYKVWDDIVESYETGKHLEGVITEG